MKIATTLSLVLFATVQFASAQELLSREEALRYAGFVSADAKQLAGTPIPTDVDAKQPVAGRDGDFGVMLLPQKNLDAASLSKAGTAVVPIGQMWLHNLTPMKDGDAISSSKLRLATVRADGDEVTVPQCALGARKKADGTLELVVYGKDKEPILTAPLKAVDAKQDGPLALTAERSYDSGDLTVTILGKYRASLKVTELIL